MTRGEIAAQDVTRCCYCGNGGSLASGHMGDITIGYTPPGRDLIRLPVCEECFSEHTSEEIWDFLDLEEEQPRIARLVFEEDSAPPSGIRPSRREPHDAA